MRIGIDALQLSPRDTGVGGYVRGLLAALAQSGDADEYVVYARPGVTAPDLGERWRWVTVRVARTRALRVAWQWFGLARQARRDGVDVLHCPSYVMPVRRRTPSVLTLHDVIALSHPRLCRRANAWHYRLLLPRVVRAADRIVASSAATKGEVCARLVVPDDKVTVVHPGVDETFFAERGAEELAEMRTRLGLPERFVLCVGNIEPKKNLATLVRAFAAAKQAHALPHALVFAGPLNWGYRDVMRAARPLIDRGAAVFTGWLPREALAATYALADLLAFVPHVEGFGLPVVEAMAAGTPVVVSDGVPSEVYEEAAVVVKSTDIDGIAAAVARVLTDADLAATLSAKGRSQARKFRWAETARAMTEIYRSLL